VSLRIKGGVNLKRKNEGGDKIGEFFKLLVSKYPNELKYTQQPQLQGRSWSATIEMSKKIKV
jgi:hypothetical protein